MSDTEKEHGARDAKLRAMLDRSGYGLQIALGFAVEESRGDHEWRVSSDEHPWAYQAANRKGYIDLVLERHNTTIVVECKRPLEAALVFLAPTMSHKARCIYQSLGREAPEYVDADVWPESIQSGDCVVDKKNQATPILEETAVEVVAATESYAREHARLRRKQHSAEGLWVPVIATTADLYACKFNPHKVSLKNGLPVDPRFEPVSVVRFRKALAPVYECPAGALHPSAVKQHLERTVFVVHAAEMVSFLKGWNVSSVR